MYTVRYFVLIFVITFNSIYSLTVPNKEELYTINVTMTDYETTQDDQYAYIQYKLPDEELTIVGYTPLVDMNTAHHMLTYACEKPGRNKPFWTDGVTCKGEEIIIHGWARNAPALKLPEDVGFVVGRNTPYKYIVVNIHYMSKLKNDNSGNQLLLSRTPRKYRAGVLLSGTSDIYLRPKAETIRTPFSCQYDGPPISIFAIRVHAHQWARVNSLYRVRDKEIIQIAKGDPQWPQSFYPLPSPITIEDGDYLVGQCVYDNSENRIIYAGSTHNDEMCNVYAMYSYQPSRKSSPPGLCWGNSHNSMTNLIPLDSIVPPLKPSDMGETKSDHHAHAEHAMIPVEANLYTNVENWPDVKTLPTELGEIGGIALSNGNNELIVFHRGSRKWEYKYFNDYRFRNDRYGPIDEDVLIHIDTRTGETKYRWGAKMFFMPHGLTIDHEGNFWVTDIAMHQVLMFKPNDLKHPALTVGELFQPGSGPSQLCRPTDVAVMKNGDFFIADGYCNSRIVKFNRKGEYLLEWGSGMSSKRDDDGFPVPNEWNIVHSIALNEDAQLICGADRENFRIQCFNSNTGEFLRQIRVEQKSTIGAIYAIEFAPNANGTILFAVTGGAQTAKKKVYMIDAKTGDILTSFDSNPTLNAPHDITVSSNAREIYVGELALAPGNALHKFELSKRKDLPTQTYSRRTYFSDKNFRISLIIMVAFATPVIIAVTVGCCIRIRNLRKLNRLNSFLNTVKNGSTNRNSVLGDWMNRRKGFELLEQYSDGENEPFDANAGNDSNENSGDETITVTNKPQGLISNNKQNTNMFKMGESL